jgi:hypothetical protein
VAYTVLAFEVENWFAQDSPLEGRVTSELVSEIEIPC